MKIQNKRLITAYSSVHFLFLRKITRVNIQRNFSKIAVVTAFLLLCLNTLGQDIPTRDSARIMETDSTRIAQADSTFTLEKEKPATQLHSPRKATLYSLALPGLGQAYNKKYWKIPLIYAGLGTMGYFIHWNNKNYNTMKQAYNDFTDDDDDTDSFNKLDGVEYYDLDDATDAESFETALENMQDYYRRNRDLLFVCIVGFYGLQIIDASVDAHFFDFDMSDDLTMNWQPSVYYMNQQSVVGITCTFTF